MILFLEQIKDMIYVMELDKIIIELNNRSIREELDRIDETLTHIMNVVRRSIEGLNRMVLYSIKKLVSRIKVLF